MAFDPWALEARDPIVTNQRLTKRDVMLYALGIGARDLQFVFEEGLQMLPTMPAVLAYPGFEWKEFNLGADWTKILHGETSVRIHQPLPVEGDLIGYTKFGPFYDKGPAKGCVAYKTREIWTAEGALMATVVNSSFLRGDGGCGSTAEDQPRPHPLPERAPDAVITYNIDESQAMIYRLSGDYNPLHIDPAIAREGGFDKPILHGLATFGFAGRAVLSTLCGNDSSRISRIDARFASPVFPGETLETDIWREGPRRAAYRSRIPARDVVVLNNGYVEFN